MEDGSAVPLETTRHSPQAASRSSYVNGRQMGDVPTL